MISAYHGNLFTEKESSNYMKGKQMSATKYQQIVAKVSEKYDNTNVTNNS